MNCPSQLFSSKRRYIALFFSLFLMAVLPANAHTLKENHAQVILRDGQVEVNLTADLARLIATLQSHQAWLMGDTTEVMPEQLTSEQQTEFVKQMFAKELRLSINEQALSLERILINIPTSHGEDHTHGVKIVLQARHSFANVSEFSIMFPKSLGAVHVSVVKPEYRMLQAGDEAHIHF
ncbi:MAG: hypothetical protein ABJE79_00035 [Marinomonas sp.]